MVASVHRDEQQTRDATETQPISNRPWYTIALDIFYQEKHSYLLTADYKIDFLKIYLQRMERTSEVINKLK